MMAQAAGLQVGWTVLARRRPPLSRPWGNLQVWEGGQGSVLLAIHGLGGSGRYWDGLARLVGDRMRVVAPDLGGFGGSDKPPVDYDLAFHLGNLDALIDQVAGTGPITLVGHSAGGVLAAVWAADHPERVQALALVGTPFPAVGDVDITRVTEAGQRPVHRLVGAAVRVAWPFTAVPLGVARGYPAGVVRDYVRRTGRSYTGTWRALLLDPELPGRLEGIDRLPAQTPVLLLDAPDDRHVSAGSRRRWETLLPGADRELVPAGGHQFLLLQGAEPLVAWLRALPETTRG